MKQDAKRSAQGLVAGVTEVSLIYAISPTVIYGVRGPMEGYSSYTLPSMTIDQYKLNKQLDD